MAILTLLPSVVLAQRVIPHAFLGLATVNGNPASDGTVVAALVDGRQVVAESVSGGSYPVLLVEPDANSFVGKTVTFTIGGIPANETALWTQGEVTQLNLTASPTQATPVPQATAAATATPVLVVGEKVTPVLPVLPVLPARKGRKDPRACKDLPAHLESAGLQALLALLARPVLPAQLAHKA